MKRAWILIYALSVLIGLAVWRAAPPRWGLEPSHALVIGSALYFGGLHRYVMRRISGPEARGASGLGGSGLRSSSLGVSRLGGTLLGLTWRAALFLAIAGFQALACYEWAPQADVRTAFVIAATWLFALGLIDPPRSTSIVRLP